MEVVQLVQRGRERDSEKFVQCARERDRERCVAPEVSG